MYSAEVSLECVETTSSPIISNVFILKTIYTCIHVYIYISKTVDGKVAGPLFFRDIDNRRRILWHVKLKSTSVHMESSVTVPVQ